MARILIGNIKGPQGIQGPKGDKGDTGATGPAGPMGAVDNTTPIEFTEAAQLANLVSGDAVNVLFGKLKKWYKDFKSVTFTGSYTDLTNKPTPADIGAASAGELTGRWNVFALNAVGWYRIGKIKNTYSNPFSCTITLKKLYAQNTGECHKCELIDSSLGSVFKSVYDKTDLPEYIQISKIRHVKDNTYHYMDVYSNSIAENLISVTFSDAISPRGKIWEVLSPTQAIPETTTGETVLAELEFEANSWLGGSL